MGSSYRQDLNRGHGPKMWEENIRLAANAVEEVERDIDVYGTGQYDNAAHDGGLAERLRIVKRLLREELPTQSEGG